MLVLVLMGLVLLAILIGVGLGSYFAGKKAGEDEVLNTFTELDDDPDLFDDMIEDLMEDHSETLEGLSEDD